MRILQIVRVTTEEKDEALREVVKAFVVALQSMGAEVWWEVIQLNKIDSANV